MKLGNLSSYLLLLFVITVLVFPLNFVLAEQPSFLQNTPTEQVEEELYVGTGLGKSTLLLKAVVIVIILNIVAVIVTLYRMRKNKQK